MKFIPKLWAERADQKHVNKRSRLLSAPGANYYNGCQTSNVWRRNMSRSRECKTTRVTETTDKNNLRSTRANFKKILKKLSWGTGIRSLSSFSLGLSQFQACTSPFGYLSGICHFILEKLQMPHGGAGRSYQNPTVGIKNRVQMAHPGQHQNCSFQ